MDGTTEDQPVRRVIHGGRQELPEHELRVEHARNRALWELGDPVWADVIVRAYTDPDRDAAELRRDQGE